MTHRTGPRVAIPLLQTTVADHLSRARGKSRSNVVSERADMGSKRPMERDCSGNYSFTQYIYQACTSAVQSIPSLHLFHLYLTGVIMLAAWLLNACAASMGVALPRSQRASTACQNYHHEGYNNGNETHTVRSGNYTRNYTVSVPTGYNDSPRRKWPVIIDFHGNNGTPDQQYNNSRFFDYTAGQQYLVVYPQGVEAHWQGPTYAVKGVDDLQFVTDLTSKIKAEYCVDHDRVYASGKSNGGGFVDLLACSHHGDEFAAFAVAAGALYSSTNSTSCSKKRAMLESHGVADKVIPYAGGVGSGGPLPDVSQWVRTYRR